MKKVHLLLLTAIVLLASCSGKGKQGGSIDREALVKRHHVNIQTIDSLSSLSVGNGNFAFTVDATGLQSFPNSYRLGVPLGTQAQWGWHSFPNVHGFEPKDTWKEYDFHGKKELYATQFNEAGRARDAANYLRNNPHRLHLGHIGLHMKQNDGSLFQPSDIQSINQTHNLWNGSIESSFKAGEYQVDVETFVTPDADRVVSEVRSTMFQAGAMSVSFRFAYPTGGHADDACDYSKPDAHSSKMIASNENLALIERTLDNDVYYVLVQWEGDAQLRETDKHVFELTPSTETLRFTTEFLAAKPNLDTLDAIAFDADETHTTQWWNAFWMRGGAIDFSDCTDPRAFELERRVVLSQHLMSIQSAGMYPPQETGLTYNSWYGKFHLEMHWWHGAHFALWGRPDLLERSLDWYNTALPVAKSIAERQGWKGVRWMKMTDPSALEAPSKVGSFLIWQQPHIIYMAELMYRSNPDTSVLNHYKTLVFETAEFMADFVDYEEIEDRYVLKGAIPAQETLRASETVNPPFELSYWHYALSTAQAWRERLGMEKNMEWEIILDKLSPLAHQDGLYLAAETALDTYVDSRFTSDHMAVLGALGIMPESRLVRKDIMTNTFNWIWDNWNWGKTWGWDYPMTAMSAARLGMPEQAIGALLMDKRTNTYLVNGHNYQDGRLRVYLPGNGGLLTAVAMMCAGWDGSEGDAPGFPKDGTWNVRWEGLQPMP